MMNKKEHLTISGLHKIISFKASMNNMRLSPLLHTAFPEIIPAIRPKRSEEELLNFNIDPN